MVGVEAVVWLHASSLEGRGVDLLFREETDEAGEVGVHGRDGKEIGRDLQGGASPAVPETSSGSR